MLLANAFIVIRLKVSHYLIVQAVCLRAHVTTISLATFVRSPGTKVKITQQKIPLLLDIGINEIDLIYSGIVVNDVDLI